MFQFVRPVKWLAVLAAVYLTVGVTAEVFTTRQIGAAIDVLNRLHIAPGGGQRATQPLVFWRWITSADPQSTDLRRVVLVLTLLVIAISVFRYLREVASSKFSMTMVYYIREAVYDQLQRVGFGFHDSLSSGQLINRALSDLQNVRAFVQTALLLSLEIVLVVIGYVALLVTRNPVIAVLSLLPLPVWVWYVLRFSRTVQPAAKAAMEAQDDNVAILTENIAGVHVIKAFATEPQEIQKYAENCDTFFQRILVRIRLFANFNPVIRAIATATNLSLVFAVAVLVLSRRLGIGDFLIIQQSMQQILGRLQGVAQINEQYQNAIVSARRLHEVLMAPATVPDRPGARPLPSASGNEHAGHVRFENVSFGYDAAKPVLHGIDLDVTGGRVVAVVGPTGSGKSTLVSLLSRFYDPQQGRVLLDGVDLRDIKLDNLRREVSFVFQETYLFSDTVAANIAYGRPHISAGEIEAAARLAQAHEFIENLPLQYETVLRERGSSLSGGQRQRLAIARAILTNPRVLVLDDATASVDPETEGLIRRGMKFAMYGRTTFVIAHRLSTVRAADLVIVLEHGKVAQVGTHAELMDEPGHYREIAAAQLYSDDGEDSDEDAAENPSHLRRTRKPSVAGPGASDPDAADLTVAHGSRRD